jgi:hypothetical protein
MEEQQEFFVPEKPRRLTVLERIQLRMKAIEKEILEAIK